MIFAAGSEGAVYNNREDFEAYVLRSAREYNNPVETVFMKFEEKDK
jgi:hypothetical protein